MSRGGLAAWLVLGCSASLVCTSLADRDYEPRTQVVHTDPHGRPVDVSGVHAALGINGAHQDAIQRQAGLAHDIALVRGKLEAAAEERERQPREDRASRETQEREAHELETSRLKPGRLEPVADHSRTSHSALSSGLSGELSPHTQGEQVESRPTLFDSDRHLGEGRLQDTIRSSPSEVDAMEESRTLDRANMRFPNGIRDIKLQDINLDPGSTGKPDDFRNNLLGLDAELGVDVGTIPNAIMTLHTNAQRAEKAMDYWYDQAKWARERGSNAWLNALGMTLQRLDADERKVAQKIGNDYMNAEDREPNARRVPRRYQRHSFDPEEWKRRTSQWKIEGGPGYTVTDDESGLALRAGYGHSAQ